MQRPNSHNLLACHDCDLLFEKFPLQAGERAICPRCYSVLAKKKFRSLDYTLVCSLTALILFFLANVFPFMSLKLQGREQITWLTSGGLELFQQGFWQLGFLVIAVGVVIPFCRIFGTLYVLIPLKINRRAWMAKTVFRFTGSVTPWAMMEVLMLGVIVGYVKLTDLATISLGFSLYFFAALIVFLALTSAALDHEEIWERLEEAL